MRIKKFEQYFTEKVENTTAAPVTETVTADEDLSQLTAELEGIGFKKGTDETWTLSIGSVKHHIRFGDYDGFEAYLEIEENGEEINAGIVSLKDMTNPKQTAEDIKAWSVSENPQEITEL